MANSPDCSEQTLQAGGACYRGGNLDSKARLAIQVYAMVLELAAISGADYSADLPGLLKDSCAWRKSSMDVRDAMLTFILTQNAQTADATVPANAQEWREAVRCLLSYQDDELDAMWHQLVCSLGHHAAIT